MNAAVLEMIKKCAAVPSIPQVVTRFLEVMQDPDFDYNDLAKVLSADPGTVSEILRLCNSAFFGVRQKVASLRHALTLLGPKRTRSLLLGRYLVDSLSQKPAPGLDMSYFWRRSLAGSVVASQLAEAIGTRNRDEVFIAALLADIGIPILAEALPERYAPIAARFSAKGEPFTTDEERKAVDVSHADVSAMVLAHWTLPEHVHQAVNLHHSQNPGTGSIAEMARLLNASDRIARLLCTQVSADILTHCTQATELVGTTPDVLIKVLPDVEKNIQELASVLRIDVIPGKNYNQIAKALGQSAVISAAT